MGRAPSDVAGTDGVPPAALLETAAADIVAYDGVRWIKSCRENLF